MAITYNPELEGFYYTLEDQRKDKNPFKVKLKTIPSKDLVKMQDGLLQRTQDDTLSLKTGSYSVTICKASIVDWQGMLDIKGKPVECKLDPSGLISDKCLNMIPANYFEEISNVASLVSQDPANLQLFKDDEEA